MFPGYIFQNVVVTELKLLYKDINFVTAVSFPKYFKEIYNLNFL